MHYGVNPLLEEEANRLIKESLAGVTSHSAKRDILTPWKQKDRLRREIYASGGVVDPATRRGQFTRVANRRQTHLNSREGVPAATRETSDPTFSLRRFLEEST